MATAEEIGDDMEVRAKKELQVLSPRMRMKRMATNGEVVNTCPFGCSVEELDSHGYCHHVVGVTRDKHFYEPMVNTRHGRRVEVKRQKLYTGETNADGDEEFVWGKAELEPVRDTDKLLRVTIDYLVYRKDAPKPNFHLSTEPKIKKPTNKSA